MKRSILLLSTLALAACNLGSEPANDPPAQITSAPTPPVVENWKPIVFEAKSVTFTPNQRSRFFSEFETVIDKSAKGEFETTEEYEKRMADVDTVLHPFSKEQHYAFTPEYAGMTYNADLQAYESIYSAFCQKGWPIERGVSCEIGSVTDETERYSGQNTFGARANVTSERGRDLYFVFPLKEFRGKQFRDSNGQYRIPLSCHVPIKKAKALQGKHVLPGIVIGIRAPKVLSGQSRLEDATVASPYAKSFDPVGIPATLEKTLCYVQESGEILQESNFN